MKDRHRRTVRRLGLLVVAASGCAAVALPAAHGATYVLNGEVPLVGTQPLVTAWDPTGSGSVDLTDDAYSAVDDGSLWERDGSERNDAFDYGLLLRVGDSDYDPENADEDTIGNIFSNAFGHAVRTPARTLDGLRVSRVDVVRAKGSSTMRSLVTLRNTSNQNRTRDVHWESNLGSDGSTELRGTSSGDADQTPADRWIVTSDSATDPGDPVVTHVFYGKRAAKRVTAINAEPTGGNDDVSVTLANLRVPKKSVRYLLFFTEMSAANQGAINAARKFNRPKRLRPLLAGISKNVRKKVVNWQFK